MVFAGCSSSQRSTTEQAEDSSEARRIVTQQQAKFEAKQRAEVQTVTLAEGTPIRVITSSEISTQTGKAGSRVTMMLDEDITDGGLVVAQRGAAVRGVISESDSGGRAEGAATLSLTLSSLALADGSMISISTNDHHSEAAIAPETAITFNLAASLTINLREGRR
jgi:hypothetical protein